MLVADAIGGTSMTPEQFEGLLKYVCTKETSAHPEGWTPDNPTWGHCAVVAVMAERVFGGGRIGKIKDARNKLFFVLLYVKVYSTFDVAAYMFASSKSCMHEWAHPCAHTDQAREGARLELRSEHDRNA